jgi:phosphoesterase RecJ-like protein
VFRLGRVTKVILEAKAIAIFCHINPDGDCIGSLLALGLALRRMGKRVFMISPDGLPHKYRTLPGAGLVKRRVSAKIDLAITVDCNNKVMLGEAFEDVRKADVVLEIDHHEFRRPFGDIVLVDTQAGAVGEIIFLLLKKLNKPIAKDIAYNILVSIIVETGSFRFPSYRPLTFRICAELTQKGIDFFRLSELIYWSKTREELLLSGLCLSRCKFIKGGRLIWSIAKIEDFKRIKGKDEHIDAVADEMRAVKKVLIAILFRETANGMLRVSLRSKRKINVARLAQAFGGGGHSDVAGCIVANKPEIKESILRQAEELL